MSGRKKRKIVPVSSAGMGQAGENYYPGTNVRITDPLLVLKCNLCGKTCWSTHEETMSCPWCKGTMTKEKTGA